MGDELGSARSDARPSAPEGIPPGVRDLSIPSPFLDGVAPVVRDPALDILVLYTATLLATLGLAPIHEATTTPEVPEELSP